MDKQWLWCRSTLAAALCIGPLLAPPASAQEVPAPAQDIPVPTPEIVPDMAGDTYSVGLGVGITTSYEGADEYKFIPGGALRGRVSGHNFYTRGLQLYVDAIPESPGQTLDLSLGPVVGVRLNRTGNVKDDRVDALGELKTAFEVGGFVGISKTGVITSAFDNISFRVAYVKDVGNAHKSHVIMPSIDYGTPLSRKTYVGASISAEFVGDGYASYYFDVSPAGAAASGLPAFRTDGGFKSWSLGLLANQSLTGDLLGGLSLFAIGSYTRLRGDFARSPIVSIAGDPNQWFGAIGLAYTF